MSDIKFCSSCGTSLSASAVFCHSCGQKQNVAPNPVPAAEVIEEIANQASVEQEKPAEASASVDTKAQDHEVPAAETPKAEPQTAQPPVVQSEAKQADTYVQPVQQAAPQPAPKPAAPQPQPQQTAPNAYQQAYQAPQQYQQAYYPQAPAPQQPPVPKKKKFPWFFTAFWVIALAAVVVWAYFLFFHEEYPKPVFTEDAQRIAIFLGAAFILIYTLSLRLSVKKLKVLPTIILILAALVGIYLFGMIELIDGDWFHDALSDITDNILPTSGQ